MPNYSGSLGFGQEFAHSLLGRCGTLDVSDCLHTVDHLVSCGVASARARVPARRNVDGSAEGDADVSMVQEARERKERKNLLVMGGSHGGFLTAHLIGQFSDMFAAAVMRNPVIAAGEMKATSDIPDWCYAEFGHSYSFSHPPASLTSQVFSNLQENSPIAHVDRVKADVLLLSGVEDKRVPPAQARLFYHALSMASARVKAEGGQRGREQGGEEKGRLRMLAFEGADHALDTVEAEVVSWEAGRRWFEHACSGEI